MRQLYPTENKIEQLDIAKQEKQLYDDLVARINELSQDFTALETNIDNIIAQLSNVVMTSLLQSTNIEADDIRAIRANITNIITSAVSSENIDTSKLTVSTLATIARAVINSLSTNELVANTAILERAQINHLDLSDVVIPNLEATVLNAISSVLETANIGTAFIDDARISAETVGTASITDATITDATVTNADIVNATIDKVDTNNITHKSNSQLLSTPDTNIFIELPRFHNGTYRILSQNNGSNLWSVTVHNEISYLDVVYDTSSRLYLSAIAYSADKMVLIGKTDDKAQTLFWMNDSLDDENAPTIYTDYDISTLILRALTKPKGRFILTVASEEGPTPTAEGWQFKQLVSDVSDLDLASYEVNDVICVINPGVTNSDFVTGETNVRTEAFANVVKVEITVYDPETETYDIVSKWHLLSGERQFDKANTYDTNQYVMSGNNTDTLDTVPVATLDNGSIVINSGASRRNNAVVNAQTITSWNGSFEFDDVVYRNITQLGIVENGVWKAGEVETPKLKADVMVNKPLFYSGPTLAATGTHIEPIDDSAIEITSSGNVTYWNVYPNSKRTDFTPPTASETSTPLIPLNKDPNRLESHPQARTGSQVNELLLWYIKDSLGYYLVEKITPEGAILSQDTHWSIPHQTTVPALLAYKHWERAASDIDGLTDYSDGALLVESEE